MFLCALRDSAVNDFIFNPSTPPAMLDLEVREARVNEQAVVGNLLELYLHDLSEYWDYDIDADGRFGYRLDDYWRMPTHTPFVFVYQGQYAGFALVNDDVCKAGNERWMAQFFVLRRWRRRGLASHAAHAIFDALPGKWEVGQIAANLPAQAFWRKLINDYTRGAYTELEGDQEAWDGPLQCFDNRAGRQALPTTLRNDA